MKSTIAFLAAASLGAFATLGAQAQNVPYSPPQNVLQLSATGSVEVQQDLLTLNLSTTRDGADANSVQTQLKVALDTALAEAKKASQPGQLDVRTGNFGIYPRYNKDGRIGGWTGTAELILEGRDFPRITQTAAKIPTLTLAGMNFGLSREARARVEGDAQAQAIEHFKTKAGELAKGFGFAGYTLREVAVNANDMGGVRPMRLNMAAAKAPMAESSPVAVEPGKANVTVTVSGSVQLK
jgi:predicted secreted protein